MASAELDLYEDVPMIDLNEELERFYNWSRPRERRLDSTLLWCISKSNVSQAALQSSLDWVCGTNPNQGQVNCGPVNVGGACYDPNTLSHHCDWAFNSYFQRMNATSSACDFQGAAQEVTTDPSELSPLVFSLISKLSSDYQIYPSLLYQIKSCQCNFITILNGYSHQLPSGIVLF